MDITHPSPKPAGRFGPTIFVSALMALVVLALVSAVVTVPQASAHSETIITFDAEAGEFPEGVAVDQDGNVYASLSALGQLVRIAPGASEAEQVGVIDGLQEGDFGLLGLAVDAVGTVYGGVFSSNPDANGVWKFDITTGDATRVAGTEAIGMANAVAFDDDGTMYISDTIAGAVWHVPVDGVAETWLEDPLLAGDQSFGFPFPLGANGIAAADGTVYVVVTELGTVVAIPVLDDGSAGEAEVIAEFSTEAGPEPIDGVAVDSKGNVYVTQLGSIAVVRLAADGSAETVATIDDGLDGPSSVAVGPNADGVESLFISNFSAALGDLSPPDGAGPGIVMVEIPD